MMDAFTSYLSGFSHYFALFISWDIFDVYFSTGKISQFKESKIDFKTWETFFEHWSGIITFFTTYFIFQFNLLLHGQIFVESRYIKPVRNPINFQLPNFLLWRCIFGNLVFYLFKILGVRDYFWGWFTWYYIIS